MRSIRNVCVHEKTWLVDFLADETWDMGRLRPPYSHTAVRGLLAVGWDYVKRLWSEMEGQAKSTSETWRDWAWSVAGPARRQSVGGTATRCWSSPREIDTGLRAVSGGLVPNNACVPLWRYPHRNKAPQFPLSSFHAYFLKSHCFDSTEEFGGPDDALFITECYAGMKTSWDPNQLWHMT